MLGRKLESIHMIGGATRNKLLVSMTEQQTGLKVEIGETESSTIGNLAVQLAASEALTRERRLIQLMQIDCSSCFVREVTEA
jgi:sugar (pentulose or hexulose) kinase